jgi:hypothetical protein
MSNDTTSADVAGVLRIDDHSAQITDPVFMSVRVRAGNNVYLNQSDSTIVLTRDGALALNDALAILLRPALRLAANQAREMVNG